MQHQLRTCQRGKLWNISPPGFGREKLAQNESKSWWLPFFETLLASNHFTTFSLTSDFQELRPTKCPQHQMTRESSLPERKGPEFAVLQWIKLNSAHRARENQSHIHQPSPQSWSHFMTAHRPACLFPVLGCVAWPP